MKSSIITVSAGGSVLEGRYNSRRRRSGSNTSIRASNSVTRSTLARNSPPCRGLITAVGEHQWLSWVGSVSARHTSLASARMSTRCA